jgi:FMN-dependent NADH-azoreductase
MQKALALSTELIAELQAADVLFISTPMYNFTIPAVLKSWIDYVMRPGFTFRLAPGWPGLLENKKARWLWCRATATKQAGRARQTTM